MLTSVDRRFTRASAPLRHLVRSVFALAMLGVAASSAAAGSPTVTTLASSAAPAQVLSPVTLAATVLGLGGGAPNGAVDFRDGATSLGTATLDARGVGRAFAGGALHTCAITTGGGVKCWGLNDHGQIGDNSVINRSSPSQVFGLTSGIVALAAGDNHTCAVTATGGVKCWGSNYIGQLGNYSNVTSPRPVDVLNLGGSTVTALAAGTDHTCALTTAGGVKCWGGGIHGRLGDGSGSDQWAPVDVSGLTRGVVAISAAGENTCALTATGGVKCWGYNSSGQIGDGTNTSRYVPVDVVTLTSGVAAISTGQDHSCAVTSGGALSCWGDNWAGKLGDGTATNRPTPTAVSGLTSGIAAVAAGTYHTCALRMDGVALCWGYNAYGQLGNGTTANSSVPIALAFLPGGLVGITVNGLGSCAFNAAGVPWCWGDNAYGEIGDGTNAVRFVPTILPSLTTAIASRATFTTASLAIGSHGLTAVYGTDGIHDASTSAALTQVIAGLTTTTTLSTSKATTFTGESVTFTATLTDPGGAFSGGSVTFVSDGSTIGVVNVASGTAVLSTAALAVGPHTITAVYGGDTVHAGSASASLTQTIVVGGTATALVASASTVTVGDPVTFTATVAPVAPAAGAPNGWVTFSDSATFSNTVAVVNAQASLTIPSLIWGTHTVTATYSGSASYGGSVSPPVPVTSVLPTLATTTTLSVAPSSVLIGEEATLTATVTAPGAVPVGGSIVFAIDGTPFDQRAIGVGATATVPVSTTVLGDHTLTAAYTGSTIGPMFFFTASTSPAMPLSVAKASTSTSLASSASPITAGRPIAFTAFVLGHGKGRPTGTVTFKNGTYAFATAPLQTVGVNRSIADGEGHGCALTQAGDVACWGSNAHGELGDGTTTDHLTPTTVGGLSGIAAVAAGQHHVCVLTENGGVRCWGDNSDGQLGDGTTVSSSTPVSVKASGGADLSGVAAIATGARHTCALARTGGMQCWGANASGQLGTGTVSASALPSPVTNLDGVVAITAGADHTCALTTAGGMKCWGRNDHGQIGDGTSGDRNTPTDVQGLTSGVAAITAGQLHTCSVTTAGGVMCWGANASGQTGSANGAGDGIPRLVPRLTSGVASVTAGNAHTCAVITDGGVACWGENENGQLGNDSVADSIVPVDVLGLTPGTILAVAAGGRHNCAALVDGSEMCWGANGSGQIGNGTTDDRLVPDPVGGVRLALSGKATVTTSSLTYGNRTIVAAYGGDDTHATSTSPTLTQTIDALTTTTALTTSKASTVAGEAVTFTATVTGSTGTPAGTVTFLVDGTAIGSANLSSGTATRTTTSLAVGSHAVTVSYGGNFRYAPSASSALTQVVGKGATAAAVVPSAASITRGRPVTFTVTVAPVAPAIGTPSGNVVFKADGSPIGTGTLSAGTASLTTSSLALGAHAVTVDYAGDGSFTATTSAATTVTITRPVLATTTTLSVSPTSLRLGATVTLKAKVAATGGTPTGDVTFSDGATTLGSATLAAGTATLSVAAQSVGTRTLTAVYAGDSTGATLVFTGSNSPPATLTVDKATSVARVASSLSPSPAGSPVTLSATLTGRYGGVPGGTIDFRDGTTTLATVALDGVGAGRSFAAGMSHACFLTAAGGVKCAGNNYSGQLGDGTNVDSPYRTVDVVGLASGVVAVTAGSAHNCALTATGGVKCWGSNAAEQIGDGTTTTRFTPTDVAGLTSGVVAVAAGDAHTCALTTTGGVKCWGLGTAGQLGRGDAPNHAPPAGVVGLTDGVTAISAGWQRSCALIADGTMKCWGSNNEGQLGDGTTTRSTTPVTVSGLTDAVGLPSGGAFADHTCAVVSGGGLKCWGNNANGGIGDGTRMIRLTPVGVSGLGSGVAAVTVGSSHTCALTTSGAVKCWGTGTNGQLGDGTNTTSLVPVAVSGLTSGIVSLSAGTDYTCAVSTDGGTACWGYFSNRQIPIPSTHISAVPVAVPDLSLALHATARTTTSALAVGWRAITAVWAGDATHDGTTSVAFSQRITARPTTTTLVSSKAPSTWGDSVTFTATVTGSGAKPTGSVDFLLDGTSLGPVQLVDGVARVTKSRIEAGTHTLKAVYAGDTTHATSTSANLTQVVAKAATTVGAISLHDPTPFGSTTDFKAIVSSPVLVSFDRPTGTVTFEEGTTTLGTVALVDGEANFSTTLAVGSHAVVATYGGDDDFAGSTASTMNVSVTPALTTTTLAVAPTAPVFGQAVTLTAAVGGASPAGIVRFYDGATWLATKTLSGGGASHVTTTLSAGSHALKAVYAGDTNHFGSNSPENATTVAKGSTSVTLTTGAAEIRPGGAVTLTAKVAPIAPATGVPTGSVAFKDGSLVLGTVNLAAGSATLTTTALTTGTHGIVAAYLGSTSFAVANSPAATVVVDPRVGTEFRVATTTAGAQQASTAAALSAGGFVVGWVGDTTAGRNVFGQRYAANGSRISGEFAFAASTTDLQSAPAMVGTADGGFATVWTATASATGATKGVWLQRRSAAGPLLAAATRLDTTAGTTRSAPAITAIPTGGLAAAWISDRSTGGGFDVLARMVDGTGKLVGAEIRVSTTTMAAIVSPPAITALANGERVAVWASTTTVGGTPVIKAQRLTASGAKSGTEFTVSPSTFAQSEPAVAGTADGGFVVVWTSAGQDGSGKGVYAQRFTATGTRAGWGFRVPTATTGDQSQPSVAARTGGGFAVAWTSTGQDGSGKSVHARRFDAVGAALDVEFRLNTTVANDQARPSIVFRNATDFLATWTSAAQDGSMEDVYGQRFSLSP